VICGYEILQIARCLACHFMLSAFVGWLAWRLTLTIFGAGDVRTRLFLSLGLALVVHVLEDYFVGWF